MFYFSIIVFLGIVFSTWFHSGNQVGPSTHSSPKGSPPSLIKQPPSPTPTLTSTPQFFSPTPIPTPQNTPPPPTVSAGISTPTAQDIYNQYLSRSPSQEDATLNGSVWSWTTARGDCQFTNGQYHTIQSNAQSYSACIASSAGKVTNIAIQTQVVINQGDTAGLIFGFQSSSSYYEFGFCINSVCVPGTVSLWRTTSPTSAYCAWPASQPDCNQIFSCVKTHLGDKNILTAILLKDTVYLYVNGQSVSPALQPFDSANPYGSGNFGVAVFDNRNATDATFTNVKIWYLSP